MWLSNITRVLLGNVTRVLLCNVTRECFRLLGYVQYYERDCSVTQNNTEYIIEKNPLHLQFTQDLQFGDYAFVCCIVLLYFSLGLSARYMAKVSHVL